jgi:hypothetical protein
MMRRHLVRAWILYRACRDALHILTTRKAR